MKNSKFLKLISLALTVALLVAVAIPTLTTSAEDTTPEYVTDITFDFEDGERHTNYGTVIDTPAEGIPAGDGKWLNIEKKSNHNTFFNDTYMKTGESYLVVFDYFVYDSNDANIWFKPVYDCEKNPQFAMQVSMSNTSTMTEWKTYSRIFTAERDSLFGFVTNDGLYIDNFRIYNMKNGNYAKSAYVADDGNDNLLNEVNVYPESASVNVKHVYDESVSANVTTFNLTKTTDGYGAFVPFHFEAGKTYKIKFKYFADGVNGTADEGSRCWFRILGASPGTGEIKLATPNTRKPTWISFDKEYTPTQSFNGLYFDANRSDIAVGGHIAMKVYDFSIIELSTENTATKQTYTFDSHDFSEYSSSESKNYTLKTVERDNKLTMALRGNCTDSAVTQICAKFDTPLTTGKYYRLSYDVKGKGNIAITMTNGGWGKSQYKTEAFGETHQGWTIDTASWKPHSTVFCAKYNSTHMYIRVASGTEVYFDNITIEEYTPFKQEIDTYDTGYEKRDAYFEIVDDPVADNAGNKVIKCIPSGSNTYLSISSARFVPQHTYEVTFKYYGTGWFRPDIASASFTVGEDIKQYTGITSSQTWKTARYIITATDAMNMASFGMLCKENVYFDDFTITDISNFDANDETLDYGSDNGAFVSDASYATVTKEVDDRDETKKVTKITFNQGSVYGNSKMIIPFALQKDKTYKIEITYKSNAFVAISWDDKALGDAGLQETNGWVTTTRYAKGTTGDMPYFAAPNTKTNGKPVDYTEFYIANITITEATEAGGLNGDGVIDTTDYTLMRNRFFSAKRDDSMMFEKYADQNSDGTVDILDMVRLSLKSANNYQ